MSGLFKKRLDDSAESRMEHPASKSWIFFTFLLAFVLCIVFGEIFWAPDFVALTLIFWTLREPDRVGFLTAFICGILMDALFGTVLGQQSLAYVTLCYLTFALSRRLPSFAYSAGTLDFSAVCDARSPLVRWALAWLGMVLGERHRCTALGYLDEAPYAPRTAVRLTLTS